MMGDFPDCDIKVCDFEISRVFVEGSEIREILGTPEYVGKWPASLGSSYYFLVQAQFSFITTINISFHFNSVFLKCSCETDSAPPQHPTAPPPQNKKNASITFKITLYYIVSGVYTSLHDKVHKILDIDIFSDGFGEGEMQKELCWLTIDHWMTASYKLWSLRQLNSQ